MAVQLQQRRGNLQVQQPAFEGPFDLLIHLIERDKLDIRDIEISRITQSYIDSIKTLEQFDPDLSSDFIYTAAWLLELKSRALLPRIARGQLALEHQEDPREELIVRLMEYKRFKELAQALDAMATGSHRVYARLAALPDPDKPGPGLAPLSLDNLFSAYNRALDKLYRETRELPPRGIAVAERISQVRLILSAGPASFERLCRGLRLSERIVTFLAVLELVRTGEVHFRQTRLFGPIQLEAVRDSNG